MPRSDWAAPEPRAAPRSGTIRYAVIHHTVLGARRPEGVPGLIREIHDLHVRGNGWDDIGYNLLVDRFGRVWEGRAGGVGTAVIGAHARGHNARSTGIALLGDWRADPVPEPAVAALHELIAFKLSLHGLVVSPDTVLPHCALAATECPGAALVPVLFGAPRRPRGK